MTDGRLKMQFDKTLLKKIPTDSLCAVYFNMREQISQQQRFNDYVLLHMNKKPILCDRAQKIVHNNKFIADNPNIDFNRKQKMTAQTFKMMMDLDENEVESQPPLENVSARLRVGVYATDERMLQASEFSVDKEWYKEHLVNCIMLVNQMQGYGQDAAPLVDHVVIDHTKQLGIYDSLVEKAILSGQSTTEETLK